MLETSGLMLKINPDKWKQHSHAQKQMREEKGRPFCNFNISKDSLRSLKIIRHTFEILLSAPKSTYFSSLLGDIHTPPAVLFLFHQYVEIN